ncbi:unnamed protein product [Cochlearia groenlandica]
MADSRDLVEPRDMEDLWIGPWIAIFTYMFLESSSKICGCDWFLQLWATFPFWTLQSIRRMVLAKEIGEITGEFKRLVKERMDP